MKKSFLKNMLMIGVLLIGVNLLAVSDINVKVQLDKFGKTKNEMLITDSDAKEKVITFESKIAGTLTDMQSDGSLATTTTIGTTKILSTISPDGQTDSSVTNNSVKSVVSSKIQGTSIIIKEDGQVETKVTPQIYKLNGKKIKAIVDTFLNGTATTRFETIDEVTGEVKIENTTENSVFEEGNIAIISEENGVLKMVVETKITKPLQF